jgi:hypothetical protein
LVREEGCTDEEEKVEEGVEGEEEIPRGRARQSELDARHQRELPRMGQPLAHFRGELCTGEQQQ